MKISECLNHPYLQLYLLSFSYTPGFIHVDFVNKFIEVEFDEKISSITLRFINQPKMSKKFYSVHYDLTEMAPDYKRFPHQMEGYLYNSNLISLELEINLKGNANLRFLVMVNNGTENVNVRGIYKSGTKDENVTVEYTAGKDNSNLRG